jgi:PIN domain nuclease of toxin-antitoxin system
MTIVLDTDAWVWLVDKPERLTPAARRAINDADVMLVSPLSCWEVARLAKDHRIDLDRDVATWVAEALLDPRMRLAVDVRDRRKGRTTRLASWRSIRSAIVATALVHDVPLVTRDERIRSFLGPRAIW